MVRNWPPRDTPPLKNTFGWNSVGWFFSDTIEMPWKVIHRSINQIKIVCKKSLHQNLKRILILHKMEIFFHFSFCLQIVIKSFFPNWDSIQIFHILESLFLKRLIWKKMSLGLFFKLSSRLKICFSLEGTRVDDAEGFLICCNGWCRLDECCKTANIHFMLKENESCRISLKDARCKIHHF